MHAAYCYGIIQAGVFIAQQFCVEETTFLGLVFKAKTLRDKMFNGHSERRH